MLKFPFLTFFLNKMELCTRTTYFLSIHLLMDISWLCGHVCGCLSVWNLESFGYVPRSRTAGSYETSIFSFSRILHSDSMWLPSGVIQTSSGNTQKAQQREPCWTHRQGGSEARTLCNTEGVIPAPDQPDTELLKWTEVP